MPKLLSNFLDPEDGKGKRKEMAPKREMRIEWPVLKVSCRLNG